MTLSVKVSGAWHTAVPKVNVGGNWKTNTALWAKVGSVWKVIYTPTLTTVQTPTNPSSGSTSNKNITCSFSINSGFRSSVTWSYTAQSNATFNDITVFNGSNVTSVSVQMTGVVQGTTATATVQAVVTDIAGATKTLTFNLSYSYN